MRGGFGGVRFAAAAEYSLAIRREAELGVSRLQSASWRGG